MALRRPRSTAVEPAPRYSMTAATALVNFDGAGSWKTWKFGNKDWQNEAWRLYDIVAEERFLANWVGDSISQARLYVAELDERGEEVGETQDARISALAGIPLGTGSQRDDMFRLAGVDLAVAGECWIVGEGAAENPEATEGAWFVVTGSAFKNVGGRVRVRRPKLLGGRDLELADGVDVLIRAWRPHPNDVDQADSPVRAALVPLREIELLTKREFAELDSRLTGAGMMFLPEGMDFPRADSDPAGIAGFMAYVQRAAAASMRDQSTAAALVPIMATLPAEMMEYLDKIRPINFWSELSAEISPMKVAAIARVAASFEIPSEILNGLGQMNHWSGWIVSEDGIKRIKPYGAVLTDALTQGFLRRAIAKIAPGADPKRFAFALDWAPLAARPNRLEEALQLHDRALLSDEETVLAGAFDPEQMPTTEERAKQIVFKLLLTQPDLILDPAVQQLLGLPAVKSVGLPPTADQNTDGGEEDEEPENQGAPNDGNAPDAESETRAVTAALNERLAVLAAAPVAALPSPEAVFNAAAKLLVYRALELAGGRLATPAERRGRWRDVPRHELHARIGPITPDKALAVTAGAWNHVAITAADLAVNADDLQRLLSGYVGELLTRGMAHHDDLLFAALGMARQGRGLVAA